MKPMTGTQKNSENISIEIDTIGVIIYGKQGAGKTLLGISMGLEWSKRIYANFSIYKNGKMINKPINDIMDIKRIRFSYTPGVIIIDEAGINANSKDTRNEQNRFLQEILFLIRKLNCSLIWISQRFESIDVNARVLSELILKMKKIRRHQKKPIFIVTKEKQVGSKLEFVQQYKFDILSFLEFKKITYNTLEKSKLQKIIKVKKNTKKEK